MSVSFFMMKIDRKNPFVVSAAVIVLLLFLHFSGLLKGPENALVLAIRPLSERLYNSSLTLNKFFKQDSELEFWRSETERLQATVTELTVANSAFQMIAEENEKLKNTLGFLQSHNFKALTAAIIAKEEAGEDRRDLIINLGSRDGLRPGLGVIGEEGVLVGKILETKERTASICLTTSPNCRLTASIQNQSKTQGLTDGDLGLTIKMSYIPQLEQINAGDLVISSGLSGDIPRGLLIGRIIQVRNESNDVWQEASIEPLLDLSKLTIVSVIIP